MSAVITNERGIALVITLLVVALLTITVVEFTYSVEVDQHMARNALSGLQASLLARSGINLGEAFLLHDDDPRVDAFTEEWCPQPGTDGYTCQIDGTNSSLVVPDNMRFRVQIIDEGGKLNINMVRFRTRAQWVRWRDSQDGDPQRQVQPLESWKMALAHLLEGRGADPEIADLVLEYWDSVYQAQYPGAVGNSPSGSGGDARAGATPSPRPQAAEPQFQQLDFPSLDDVGVIAGFTPSLIRRLRPVLTALPGNQLRVNANTAPREVLQAIVGDEEVVSNIISQRSETPLRQADLVGLIRNLNQASSDTRNYAGAMLGVTSFYYRVRASAKVNPNPVTGRGGIGRSASMLVRRIRRSARRTGASAVPWSLTQLDWQKEGGARLFREQRGGDAGDQSQDLRGLGSRG